MTALSAALVLVGDMASVGGMVYGVSLGRPVPGAPKDTLRSRIDGGYVLLAFAAVTIVLTASLIHG